MSASFTLIVYALSTGQIQASTFHSCETEHRPIVVDNTRTFWGADNDVLEVDGSAEPESHYVVMMETGPVVLERPAVPYSIEKTVILAGGTDSTLISGLTDPVEIVIDDPDPLTETVKETVTGGLFEFSADVPGLYTIQISRFPFLPLTLEITAVDVSSAPGADFNTDFSFEFG